ncbi:HalOD1 output domain-containing protein [Halomarina salina]|nr:HalOD1 output domain-containing protein [Halomarina salina]
MGREQRAPDGPAAGGRRTLRHRSTFDPTGEESLLGAVTDGLSEVVGTDPKSLDPPLATVAAWEALERLVERHADADPAPIHYVQFDYREFVVAVSGDGEIVIYDAEQ